MLAFCALGWLPQRASSIPIPSSFSPAAARPRSPIFRFSGVLTQKYDDLD
jgi:hypothetical protein